MRSAAIYNPKKTAKVPHGGEGFFTIFFSTPETSPGFFGKGKAAAVPWTASRSTRLRKAASAARLGGLLFAGRVVARVADRSVQRLARRAVVGFMRHAYD